MAFVQPPPRFSQGRGERETSDRWWTTRDHGKGTDGRHLARCLLPAFLCAHIFIKRETSGYKAGLCWCWPGLTVEHSSFSYQEYPECSGFQAGAKDLFISFGICPMNQSVYSECGVFVFIFSKCTVSEMPTSGDLKSGDSLFHCPTGISTYPPPSPTNWPSPQWEWLRTLNEVLHWVHTIKIRNHRFDARNNLCQRLSTCKNAPETVQRIRKIQVLS